MRVIVYHGMYGCETGCCGHWVEIGNDDDTLDEDEDMSFGFDHPLKRKFTFHCGEVGEGIEFAKNCILKEFGEEHVKDLDWEHCRIVEDCQW